MEPTADWDGVHRHGPWPGAETANLRYASGRVDVRDIPHVVIREFFHRAVVLRVAPAPGAGAASSPRSTASDSVVVRHGPRGQEPLVRPSGTHSVRFAHWPPEVEEHVVPNADVVLHEHSSRAIVLRGNATSITFQDLVWLDYIPSLDAFARLVELNVHHVDVHSLPDMSALTRLLKLELCFLPDMRSLPLEVGGIPNLRQLALVGLFNLTAFPDELVGRLAGTLRVLCIEKCGQPHRAFRVPAAVYRELGALQSLELVDSTDCDMLVLPDLSGLSRLVSLNVRFHHALQTIERCPRSLITLHLDASAVTAIPPEIGLLVGLTSVHFSDLAIASVPNEMQCLTNLAALTVVRCDLLVAFGQDILRGCTRLEHFELDGDDNENPAVFWQVVACVRDMQHLTSIRLYNWPADGHLTSALVNAFVAFPPRFPDPDVCEFDHRFLRFCVSVSRHLGHGGPDPSVHASLLARLPGLVADEGDWQEAREARTGDAIMPFMCAWRAAKVARQLAFVAGHHTRLGARSSAHVLDAGVLRLVLEHEAVTAPDAYMLEWAPMIVHRGGVPFPRSGSAR